MDSYYNTNSNGGSGSGNELEELMDLYDYNNGIFKYGGSGSNGNNVTNAGHHVFQQPIAHTTPPASTAAFQQPATIDPRLLQATPPAPVPAPFVTPAAPQVAINPGHQVNNNTNSAAVTDTPSKKTKQSRSKKQKRTPVANSAAGPDHSAPNTALNSFFHGVMQPKRTPVANAAAVPNYSAPNNAINSFGLGILQPQQVVIPQQQLPMGYQPSTNPAHAHLLQGAQTSHWPSVPANVSVFASPPVMQMQNASMYTPQQNAQQYNAPMPAQQQPSSSVSRAGSGLMQPAASRSYPDRNALDEATVQVYNNAGIERLTHAVALFQSRHGALLDPGTLSIYTTGAELQLRALSSPNAGLAKEILDVHLAEAKSLLDDLAFPPIAQPQLKIDNAFLDVCNIAAEAHQMFFTQSSNALKSFLSSDAPTQNMIIANTPNEYVPEESTKRKRTDSFTSGVPLYSPCTENFLNGSRDTDAVDREVTPETPGFPFGEDDSALPGFEEDVEPADDIQEEMDAVALPNPTSTEVVGDFADVTTEVSDEEITVPDTTVTTDAFEKESGIDDDLVSLFGEDEKDIAASAPVPMIGGIPRSSFPKTPLPPVYDAANAITQEDEDFANTLQNGSGPYAGASTKHSLSHNQTGSSMQIDNDGFTYAQRNTMNGHQNFGGFGQTSTMGRRRRINPFEGPDMSTDDSFDGFTPMNNQEQGGDMLDDSEPDVTTISSSYASPPTQQNSYLQPSTYPTSQAQAQAQDQQRASRLSAYASARPSSYTPAQVQQSTPQQQMERSFPAAPQYAQPQQYNNAPQMSQQYNNTPQMSQQYSTPQQSSSTSQTPQTTQSTTDDEDDDDLDLAVRDFSSTNMVAHPPVIPQPQYQPVIRPALTAAGPDRPLCALFLASNGMNCPYGAACHDRHYYMFGTTGIQPNQAIGSQINYMSTTAVQNQDVVQEGLMVTRVRRGAYFHCKNCGQRKPVTLKNDGVRCTPCFKRWCTGKD